MLNKYELKGKCDLIYLIEISHFSIIYYVINMDRGGVTCKVFSQIDNSHPIYFTIN